MKPSLTELVDVILRRMAEQPEQTHSENGLRTWLVGQGYSKRDIEAAIKLVRPRFLAPPQDMNRSARSVRLLSAEEEYKLTGEARDALARLELYELLDPAERELLLDQITHYEGEVGLPELDYLVSWIVCSTRNVESQQTLYSVLEGEGETVH